MSSIPVAASALATLLLASTSSAQSLDLLQIGLAMDDVAISPDGRTAVVRENNNQHYTRLYDLQAGTLAALVPNSTPLGDLMGECHDGVAITNTRAVVLGTSVQILDLTNLANPLLTTTAAGYRPRDVAITPDGSIACVRGGSTTGSYQGGHYLFDLSNGLLLAYGPGQPVPYPYTGTFTTTEGFDVDSVVANDRYALFTSYLPGAPGRTRVTIWDLHPAGGGPPIVAYETTPCGGCGDLAGAPYDVSLSPDGQHAAVRSERSVALFDLSGAVPSMLWQHRPWHNPGYYFMEALDAVELTDSRVVVLSRWGGGMQVDLFDYAGNNAHYGTQGSPHDLAVNPSQTRAVVRNKLGVFLFDLTQIPADGLLLPLDRQGAPSSATAYFSGLDTIACNDRYAVSIAKSAGFTDTIASFWRIDHDVLERYATQVIAGSRPLDLALTPDGTRVVISGNANVSVFHLASGDRLYSHNPVAPQTWYPWCNGVATSDTHAVGVSMYGQQAGWVELVDMTPFFTRYCASSPNSAGPGAHLTLGASPSFTAHNLHLLVDGLPPGVQGQFLMADTATQIPFGAGFSCVTGGIVAFPPQLANACGAAAYTLVFDPSLAPGVTRHFQFTYRDPAAGASFNATEGATMTFTP